MSVQKYRFGFSAAGFISFMLIMLPNIIWMLFPPPDDPISGNLSSIAALNVIMSAAQWIMIAMLIMIKSDEYKRGGNNIYYIVICGICLVLYYASWILYYCGQYSPIMLVGMAVEPCVYFIAFALWQRNYISLPPAIVFAVFHISITVCNFVK